jgi:hypothetical protein
VDASDQALRSRKTTEQLLASSRSADPRLGSTTRSICSIPSSSALQSLRTRSPSLPATSRARVGCSRRSPNG